MFINPKALKIYNTNPHKISAELESIDYKLLSTHGNAYQQCLYTQFEHEKFCMVPFGFDKEYATIYAIYGWMLQADDLNLMRLSLVKKLHEEMFGMQGKNQFKEGKDIHEQKLPTRGIIIVYFSRANSNTKNPKNKKKIKNIQFTDFKNNVLKQLQTKYLRNLKGIYVCHEGFLAKSINALPFSKIGLHNQLIQSLIKFCDNLEDLVKCLGPLFQCELVREEVQEYNQSIYWLSIYSDNDKKMAKRKMIEQVGQIDAGPSFYKRKITDYQFDYETGIPITLNGLIKLLQSNKSFLQSQGIFRKACRQQKLKKLQEQLIDCCLEEQVIKIGSKYDPDTIACCIKAIFNKLNPPIIEYQHYDNLIGKMDNMYKELKDKQKDNGKDTKIQTNITKQLENQKQNIVMQDKKYFIGAQKLELEQDQIDELLTYLSCIIGTNERAILLRLIKFFRDSIITNQKRNKMSPYNLSVVMGPCIFRPKKYSINDLMNSPRLANLLYLLIRDPSKLQ